MAEENINENVLKLLAIPELTNKNFFKPKGRFFWLPLAKYIKHPILPQTKRTVPLVYSCMFNFLRISLFSLTDFY